MDDAPSILIAADTEATAHGVVRRLATEFGGTHISSDARHIVSDFEACRPAVLVLAFHEFDRAERCLATLYSQSRLVHGMAHRTIVLCRIGDLARVYARCRDGCFDDYAVFWPAASDEPRLAMAIHHALEALADKSPAAGAARLISHARRLACIEPALAAHARRFAHEVNRTRAAAASAARGADPMVLKRVRTMGESVDALCEAAHTLAGALGPQLQAVRDICALAAEVRPSVLAVDDDIFQQTLIARLLDGTRIDLSCASSGMQALHAMARHRPDLVLIDVALPDVDGIALTREIKSTPAFADVPVIIVTAMSHRGVVLESVKAGAADFMVKPYRRATLLDKLQALLPGCTA